MYPAVCRCIRRVSQASTRMRKIPMKRPFAVVKLQQGARLVWESHQQPMRGKAGQPVEVVSGELGVMFLGHSSFLLQMHGANVLIDPVFATRLIVLRRQRRPGIKVEDLPAIDVVLLTHAHMDHLNRPTLRRVARATRFRTGRAPIVIVPAGVEDLVRDLGFREVRSLRWWGCTEVCGLDVTFTPAKHWGARMFSDTHRLFGGYVLCDGAGHRVYHSGDTAYFDGFKEIGRKLHPQVALVAHRSVLSRQLSFGAYQPGRGFAGIRRCRRGDHDPHALRDLSPGPRADGRASRPADGGCPAARHCRAGTDSGGGRNISRHARSVPRMRRRFARSRIE